eukprot:7169527-Ditylum_brightwellii.AAC.1
MCRKGIPPTLRRCVWLTNVTLAFSPNKLKQIDEETYKYASQSHEKIIDSGWEVAKKTAFPNGNDEDAPIPDFGLGQNILKDILRDGHQYSGDMTNKLPAEGTERIKQILYATEKVLGVEYCPLLPN